MRHTMVLLAAVAQVIATYGAIKAKDKGLKITEIIELKRLDEAKAAYLKSLELDPGNALALKGLDFIEQLERKAKEGGKK